MGLKSRICAYVVLGVVLLVVFDPRTWGQSLDSHGDEVGILLGGMFLIGAATAVVVLTAIVVATEYAFKANQRRRLPREGTSSRATETGRSWYE